MKMGIIEFGRAGGLKVAFVIFKIASDPGLSRARESLH